jgi:antitoxin (DNA-binding transcriptional repressor) of toxin-antitoxin stability system
MKAVGVKQLKARLSEYLRLVKSGETLLVTERDDVIAELRPARRRLHASEGLEEVLEALAATGEITRAGLPKRGWKWRPKGLGLEPGTAQKILDELRAER